MGASHSGEGHSPKPNKTIRKDMKAYKQSLGKFKQSHTQKSGPNAILKWKECLIGLLSIEKPDVQYWDELTKSLIEYVMADKEDNSVWWIANFQRLSLTFSTYASQLSLTSDTLVIDCGKLEDKAPTDLSPKLFSERSSVISSIGVSSPLGRGIMSSTILSSHDSPRPTTYQLKLNLQNQINNPKHIVYELIQEFLIFFNKKFSGYIPQIQNGEVLGQKLDNLYHTGKTLIKHFVSIIKEFVIWIYRELMEQFIAALNQEDFNLYALVEGLIYEILFFESSSTINQFIFNILKRKYSADVQKFQGNIQKMFKMTLEDHDEYLANSCLLLKGMKPMYGKVVRKLRRMRNQISPYKKYDEIIQLNQEILACINDYYKEDYEKIREAELSLGRDAKTSILTYCIIQSKNKNLVLDRIFIEEFVEPSCLEATPDFPGFCISADYILNAAEELKEI